MSPDPARDFSSLSRLPGFPEGLLKAHLAKYRETVRIVNLLRQRLADDPGSPLEWSELRRRAGYEWNGLRLHELFFENLSPGMKAPGASLRRALERNWRSLEAWREGFRGLGSVRGSGWVVLYQDSVTGSLFNHRLEGHGEGDPEGASPLLVMDVWDHAYTGMDLGGYLDAFLSNIDWARVDSRLAAGTPEGPGAAWPPHRTSRGRRPLTRAPMRSPVADPRAWNPAGPGPSR